jgi:hypothetical protein
MQDDTHHRDSSQDAAKLSIARRREILKQIGAASAAGAAATSPMSALAGGSTSGRWCHSPIDYNKCVHASISGMGSVMHSAQAGNEVCSKKCSHYASYTNWPSNCTNGQKTITCNSSNDKYNTKFCDVFNCNNHSAKDSNGVSLYSYQWGKWTMNSNCLLSKSLPTLCASNPSTMEAHWATAVGNANLLQSPVGSAPFPYSPAQVCGYYSSADLTMKSAAYTFFSQYCEQYA